MTTLSFQEPFMMKLSRLFAFLLVIGAFSGAAIAQVEFQVEELDPQLSGRVDSLDISVPLPEWVSPERIYWDWEYSSLDSGYLIVNFARFPEALSEKAFFEVLSEKGDLVETVPLRSMDIEEPSIFVPTSYVRLRLRLPEATDADEITLTNVVYEKEAGAVSSIVLPDEREHLVEVDDPEIIRAAKAVAQLIFWKGLSSYNCTGFLVSEDLFITNDHCVNNQQLCRRAHAVFGRQLDASGRLIRGKSYRCAEVLATSYEADAALLRLVNGPGMEHGFLELADRGPRKGEPVVVIGHAAGQPKQVSRAGCMVGRPSVWGRKPTADFQHSCDTLGGNSGSPIMSQDMLVVGLHHFGFGEIPSATKWNQAVKIEIVVSNLDLLNLLER